MLWNFPLVVSLLVFKKFQSLDFGIKVAGPKRAIIENITEISQKIKK
jgi:hypothetical protein